jgi:hypothetical protein
MSERSLPEESIFAPALELESGSERPAFLDRACGCNPMLRAEVEAPLRADERDGDLLDLPETAATRLDRPGAVIGPYMLLHEIGEGGMGVIWLPEQAHQKGIIHRDLKPSNVLEEVEASPPSTAYRFSKFLRRHHGPVVAASTIVVPLVGGIVGTMLGLERAKVAWRADAKRATREQAAKETAERRLAQIEKAIAILGAIFEHLDPQAEEKEGRPLRAILGERLDRAAAELDGEAVGDPLVMAALQERLARTDLGVGRPAEAKALFTKALTIRRGQLGDDHPDTLATWSWFATALREVGEVREAIAVGERVKDAQVRVRGVDHSETVSTLRNLALAHWAIGKNREAIALGEQVRDARIRNLGALAS